MRLRRGSFPPNTPEDGQASDLIGLQDEAKELARERDRLRLLNPAGPPIPLIQNQLAVLIAENKRER